jgi:hypothetical protein
VIGAQDIHGDVTVAGRRSRRSRRESELRQFILSRFSAIMIAGASTALAQ